MASALVVKACAMAHGKVIFCTSTAPHVYGSVREMARAAPCREAKCGISHDSFLNLLLHPFFFTLLDDVLYYQFLAIIATCLFSFADG